MKHLSIKVVIALITFILGVIAATIWLAFHNPHLSVIQRMESNIEMASPQTLPSDTKVYSVTFCDLLRNPDRYDHKLIRTQAIHETDIDISALYSQECKVKNIWVHDRCAPGEVACDKVFEPLFNVHSPKAEVDVIGRFFAYGEDARTHRLEVLEVISAKPVN